MSLSRSVTAIAATGLVALTAACGSSAAEPGGDRPSAAAADPIVFAAVPSENSQSLQGQYENVITLLEKETGREIEFQNATDYAAVIEGQRAGKIDIAMYGPFSYKIAKDGGAPIEPVAAGVEKKGDRPGYHSTAWTTPDSGITSLKDLAGKKVCFVDPASTSGTLFPSQGLLEVGLDPTKDLTQIFAGAHDASLLAVKSGQCDAGFAQESQMPSFLESGQLEEGALRQIWTSPIIPGSPMAMSTQSLDAATQDKVRTALREKANVDVLTQAGICAGGSTCALPDDATWGYVPVADDTYAPVRQVCAATKAPACNTPE